MTARVLGCFLLGSNLSRENFVEDVEISRLRDMSVESGLLCRLDIAIAAVARQGHEDDVIEEMVFADTARNLVAAHHGETDVNERDVGMLAFDRRYG